MAETVTVECADPEVLAEHQAGEPCSGRVVYRRDGVLSRHTTADEFAVWLAAGWRYDLVFPDRETAASALALWVAEGRNVWLSRPEGTDYASSGNDILAALAAGATYRIEAPEPAEPEPEPTPKPERPALPHGVKPVGWSPRYGCWVLHHCDVPEGWGYSNGPNAHRGNAWLVAKGKEVGTHIILARPVEPATERVPWWEALASGVELVGFGPIDSASRTADGGVRLHNAIGTRYIFRGDDPTVEVLTEDGAR